MAVSKRVRYEVLRRDDYTCRYCGAKAPDVEITVDHVVPVALGGSDEPTNLVAACRDCNAGKTSSSPDAPLVADVAEDALRWSRAVAEAGRQMIAQLGAEDAVFTQFDDWWSDWTYGSRKLPLPRPENWRGSVSAFLEAGLPMEVLEDCIRIAMESSANANNTWRYMCGVAWKRVAWLQEAAREAVDSPERDAAALARDPGDCGPDHFLRLYSEAEREQAVAALGHLGVAPTATAALEQAIRSSRTDLQWLQAQVVLLLDALPGGVGAEAMRSARSGLYSAYGATFNMADFVDHAVANATDAFSAERSAV